MCACMRVCVRACMCTCAHMHAYAHVYISIQTYLLSCSTHEVLNRAKVHYLRKLRKDLDDHHVHDT